MIPRGGFWYWFLDGYITLVVLYRIPPIHILVHLAEQGHLLVVMEANEESAVQDFLEILEEHRKACERQGKYVEAEIAKNRLDELKLHEENRRREAMRSRQIAERLGVEEAHMLEFQQFNMIWDKKFTDYETHAQNLIDAMKERHAAELR